MREEGLVEDEESADLEESEWPSLKLSLSEEISSAVDGSVGVGDELVDVVEEDESVDWRKVNGRV